MSVIIKAEDKPYFEIVCKGAPETIKTLSKTSTVPENFTSRLEDYTSQGYRVIAMATKILGELSLEEVNEMNREQVETELNFIGLIILENKLKPQTSGVICTLKNAHLKVVMITGKFRKY